MDDTTGREVDINRGITYNFHIFHGFGEEASAGFDIGYGAQSIDTRSDREGKFAATAGHTNGKRLRTGLKELVLIKNRDLQIGYRQALVFDVTDQIVGEAGQLSLRPTVGWLT